MTFTQIAPRVKGCSGSPFTETTRPSSTPIRSPQVSGQSWGQTERLNSIMGIALSKVPAKTILTAKAQRTQRLLFYLFSFDPAEKSGIKGKQITTCPTRQRTLCTNTFLFTLPPSELSAHGKIFSFLASHQKRKDIFSSRTLRLERSGR